MTARKTKKQKVTNDTECCWRCKVNETQTASGNEKYYTHLEKQSVVLNKVKCSVTIYFGTSVLSIYLRKTKFIFMQIYI